MAGLYIHIPYCTQACHYCDFHFSTNLSHKSTMVDCIAEELRMQADYLEGEPLQSIYFGGGTPSLLSHEELSTIISSIKATYPLSSPLEVTLEANPENITAEKLQSLYAAGINRLSLGVQSFHQPYLDYLNRSHNAGEARKALDLLAASAFNNYSIDLIYGIQQDDMTIWESDLRILTTYRPLHISAYNLTIEQNTVFGNWLRKGKINEASQDQAAKQFEYTHHYLNEHGYEHYEVSNYCLNDGYSRHNSAYWKNEMYLGVGPGAHSYNRINRRYNCRNNQKYMRSIGEGSVPYEEENLSREDKINERIITGLRTRWGCDLQAINSQFACDLLQENEKKLEEFSAMGLIEINGHQLTLTLKGQLVADTISTELMIES